MDEVKVVTNNVPRDVINGWELSAKERAEFDYIDWPAVEAGEASAEFFRYKGMLYDLHDAMTTQGWDGSPLKDWAGYYSDSFFSGVVFRYVQDGENYEGPVFDWERVIVGRYYS